MNRFTFYLVAGLYGLLCGCTLSSSSSTDTVKHWPAEPWQESTALTHLDPRFSDNLSGAHWNPVTQTLFVVTNKPGFMFRLQLQNGEFEIVGKYSFPGDIEAVTQVDYNEDIAYILDEKGEEIRCVRWLNDTDFLLLKRWSLSELAPAVGRRGAEGIVFIPDSFLQEMGFVDGDGFPRLSRNGMGGLMFVAHQVAGDIYVFDMSPLVNTIDLVGVYSTARSESSGLAFDREYGLFYIWHNTDGNILELADLASELNGKQRKFKTIHEIKGPKTGNLEGIALGSLADNGYIFFMCDDDNQNNYGLMAFYHFPVLSGAENGTKGKPQ